MLTADEKIDDALDVGSGWGTIYYLLKELGSNVSALDIENPSNIEEDRFQNHDINNCDSLPQTDCSLDVVICSEVIEHIEEPNRLINEIYRILRSNGFAIITIPNILSLSSRYNFLIKGMHAKFSWNKSTDNVFEPKHGVGGHISAIDYFYLNWLLNKVGFRIERIRVNYAKVPENILKKCIFKLLQFFIFIIQDSKIPKKIELGDTLILKIRKKCVNNNEL